jgi:hypothetical protein
MNITKRFVFLCKPKVSKGTTGQAGADKAGRVGAGGLDRAGKRGRAGKPGATGPGRAVPAIAGSERQPGPRGQAGEQRPSW